MSGPYDDVIIPYITQQCDWELELAAVIGRPARYVPRASALSFIAGYTIVNDISMRDRLYPSGDSKRGADWLACKSAPTFLPTGPLLVPARFIPDPAQLTITLRLNGDVMQNESTSDMIFDLPRLIEHTSQCAMMLPGDLLLTGSPAGNGVHHGRFIADGDVMDGRITGLGVQRTPAVAEAEPDLS
jgi:2,4-diketo-3-deoxy-L-fuconate hydrolase